MHDAFEIYAMLVRFMYNCLRLDFIETILRNTTLFGCSYIYVASYVPVDICIYIYYYELKIS